MKERIIHLLGGVTEDEAQLVTNAAKALASTAKELGERAKAIIRNDTVEHAKQKLKADCARRENCMGCPSRHESGYCKIGNAIPCQWEI